jgi:hypothetical protein
MSTGPIQSFSHFLRKKCLQVIKCHILSMVSRKEGILIGRSYNDSNYGVFMKFEDKFKPGDIICSDRFHNGLCMVVNYLQQYSLNGEPRYSCNDLVREGQRWSAYEMENYMFNRSYKWRIATDNDIAKYLSQFINIQLGKVGEHYIAKLTDTGIVLEDTRFIDGNIHLEEDELVDLKRIIDERVG